jgi:hypothetical protein
LIPLILILEGSSLVGVAKASQTEVAGYLRVGVRPDFQGGDGRLGHWNLYGRLLNEGPYALLDLRHSVAPQQPGRTEPWTALHMRVEGASVAGADSGGGSLASYRLSQLYAEAGQVLIDGVTWRVGTLETWVGDLGLYDMRPTQLFSGVVGLSGELDAGPVALLLGAGGNEVLAGGGQLRWQPSAHVDLALGGELRRQPATPGNQDAPHATPGLELEPWLRGEVVEGWMAEAPGQTLDLPDPIPTAAGSSKLVGALGFGDWGPLAWWTTQASFARLPPELQSTEVVDGESHTLHTTELTDQRTVLTVGSEVLLRPSPKLDVVVAALWADHQDADNDLAPSEHDRSYGSVVARLTAHLRPTFHWLGEGSLAREWSRNGNLYREHADSIFANTGGIVDARGFELGDTDTRVTLQAKTGLVFSPLGPGVWTRPSLRVLYGAQLSNENNAFGHGFVDTLDQYNEFGNVERHWHHVLALETEAWF